MTNREYLTLSILDIEEKYSNISNFLMLIHNTDKRMQTDPNFNEDIVSLLYKSKKIKKLLRKLVETDDIEILIDESGCEKLQKDYESTLIDLEYIIQTNL